MISASEIQYPKEYLTPESRVGKKFKFFKIEPYEFKKEEPKVEKTIKIGEGSNRIAYTQNYNKFFTELYSPSYSDIIDEILDEYSNSSNK